MSLFNFDYRNGRLVVAGGMLVLAGGVIGGGCGGSNIDVSTEAAFCQDAAEIDCSPSTVQACYGANQSTLGTDTNTCIAIRSASQFCNSQNLPYNPNFAVACLNAHAAVFSSATLDPGALAQMTQACNAVFNNGGTTGATCADDTGCDVGDGYSCIVHQGSMGTCQLPAPVTAGNSCASPAAQCVDGNGNAGAYYCESSQHCVSDPTNGAACGPGAPCAAGLRCDPTAMVCQPQYPDQHSCSVNSDCAGGFCVLTSSMTSVCTGQYTLAFGSPTCNGFVNSADD